MTESTATSKSAARMNGDIARVHRACLRNSFAGLHNLPSVAKQVAEKRRMHREPEEKHPSAAKADVDFAAFTGRLKSFPFKTTNFSATRKVLDSIGPPGMTEGVPGYKIILERLCRKTAALVWTKFGVVVVLGLIFLAGSGIEAQQKPSADSGDFLRVEAL